MKAGKTVFVWTILMFAVAMPAIAAISWHGGTSDDWSVADNWVGTSGRVYFTKSFSFNGVNYTARRPDSKMTTDLSGSYKWVSGSASDAYYSLCFGKTPDGGAWRLHGYKSDGTVCTFDNSEAPLEKDYDLDSICIGFNDHSSSARFHAINFKIRHLTVGGDSSYGARLVKLLGQDVTGRLQLDDRSADGTTTWAPVSLETTGDIQFYRGAVVATNAVITCGGHMNLYNLAVDKTGGDWTVASNLVIGAGSGSVAAFANHSGKVKVNGDLKIGDGGGTGTLTVKGGTFEVASGKWTRFESGATGSRIVLGGGTFKTKRIYDADGLGTVVLDGGTLQANASDARGLIGTNTVATVGGAGGAIATGGYDVFIYAGIGAEPGSAGGLALSGGGVVTLAGTNTYAGKTTVEAGTAVVVASPGDIGGGIAVTAPAATPANGVYSLVSISGDGAFADDVLNGVVAPAGATLRLSTDRKTILCVYGDDLGPVWIGGATGSLSVADNWANGEVPTGGNCFIGNAAPASLTLGDTFSPSAITFTRGSGTIAISGERELTGIVAITNLASARQVFNCAVRGGKIDFYNTNKLCEFRGGITLATPSFSSASGSEELCGLVGSWRLTGNWKPGSGNRVRDGSSVTVEGQLTNPGAMSIDAGCVVTAATMRVDTSERFVYNNNGRLVVLGELRTENGNADVFFMRTNTTNNATVEFGSFVNATRGRWTYVNAPEIVVGAGGLDIVGPSRACFYDSPTLRPRAARYEIGSTSNIAYFVDGMLSLDTTQLDTGDPATVVVGEILANRGSSRTGAVDVTGNGKVVFDSASSFSGGLAVRDSATVAVNAGCRPGAGDVTVRDGAALQVAESGEVALGGALTLADGAALEFNFTERGAAPKLAMTNSVVQYLAASNVVAATAPETLTGETFGLKVACYNIRLAPCADDDNSGDPYRNWVNRKTAVVNFVKDMNPDIIGFQEVDPGPMADLKSMLADYEIIGKHRTAQNTQRGTPVAYRKSRFTQLDGGTFWLSTTPDVAGSKGLPDGKTATDGETCSWVLLRDNATQGVFCLFSTHLDWIQADCRKLQMDIAVNRAMAYVNVGIPAILVGDMNVRHGSGEITTRCPERVMKDALYAAPRNAVSGPWRTFDGWRYMAEESQCSDIMDRPDRNDFGSRCDYIFVSRDIAVDSFATRNDLQPDSVSAGLPQYPSDHYAILSELTVPAKRAAWRGVVRVEKTCPVVQAERRFVLTQGAGFSADRLDFDFDRSWVRSMAVENGEIVLYTRKCALAVRVR